MTITFKEKINSSRINEKDVDDLFDFLINNRSYIYATFSILHKKRKPIDEVKINQIINSKKEISILKAEELKELDKYINLMGNFYKCDLDILGNRRGRLLEKLILVNGPINNIRDFNVLEEVIICNDGIEISTRDLDILFYGDKVEIHECKSTVENVIRSPISTEDKEKMGLMCKTKMLIEIDNVECNIYISTYTLDIRNYTQQVLHNHGFSDIKILSGNEIISCFCN